MSVQPNLIASLCPTPDLLIVECGEEMSVEWNAFVEEASGSYCYLFEWKQVLERVYGLQTYYLAFYSAGILMGILPLAVMPRFPGSEKKSVSLPYCNYGGLLVGDGVDTLPIKSAAISYLTRLGINKIEFRNIDSGVVAALEVTMILTLPQNVDLLWKQIGDKARNQVRKAQKAGLTLRWGCDQADDLYAIYAKNMGRLGTPVHSSKFIKEILLSFSGQVDVLTVRLGARPIGAMLIIKHCGIWSDPIASCLVEFNKYNPNMLMYWEALRAACDSGSNSFDFGRSQKNSGTHRFKKQWGARAVALNYHSYVNGILMPSTTSNFYRGQTASRLAKVWQRLPTFVQMRLGPVVRRWLP